MVRMVQRRSCSRACQCCQIHRKNASGSHSDLLKIPNCAYCQLKHLQEANQESDKRKTRLNKPENLLDSTHQSSQRFSILCSISRGSSAGNSSHPSFSVSFGLPTGVNIQETLALEPEAPSPAQQPKVPVCCLASLNKPEIPILLLGAIAAVVSGVIFPLFGVLLSNMLRTFFEAPRKLRKDSRFWALMFLVLALAAFVSSPLQQ